MDIKLELPSGEWKKEIIEYKQEIIDNRGAWEGTGCLKSCNVNDFIKNSEDWKNGVNLPKGTVPATEYLAIKQERIVGMVNIRHTIDHPLLSQFGGHIGYQVRVSERHKGYCVDILRLALEECIKMGIDEVLISCNTENTASRKCILANGGKYENTVSLKSPKGDEIKIERYWINLK